MIRGLAVGYGGFPILEGFDLDLRPGRITAIVGSNGAGKSTLLKALAGLLPRAGTITLDGQRLRPGDAAQAVRAGLIMVAEGRHLFPQMTVLENLQLGGWLLPRRERAGRVERVLALFPRLAERRHQLDAHHERRGAADGGHSPGARRAARACSCSTSPRWDWPLGWSMRSSPSCTACGTKEPPSS